MQSHHFRHSWASNSSKPIKKSSCISASCLVIIPGIFCEWTSSQRSAHNNMPWCRCKSPGTMEERTRKGLHRSNERPLASGRPQCKWSQRSKCTGWSDICTNLSGGSAPRPQNLDTNQLCDNFWKSVQKLNTMLNYVEPVCGFDMLSWLWILLLHMFAYFCGLPWSWFQNGIASIYQYKWILFQMSHL